MKACRLGFLFAALGVAVVVARPVAGQGVTTAAVSGRVTGQDGQPLVAIQITVTNESTGLVKSSLTGTQGTYYVAGLQVGAPYSVKATGVGFQEQTRDNLTLALGQNLVVNFSLETQVVELGEIAITANITRSQIINPKRTGSEQLVTQTQISTLPTIGRNFTDFVNLSPVTGAGGGATSVGSQNNRFNNIQIDGAITQDLFGLGSTGQPGGQASARSISIEAVKEYQVMAAPYDVRQSGFSGGLINAVTKNGTNEWHGSAYAFYNNENFLRETIPIGGNPVTVGKYSNAIYGGSVGGPIMQDRVHFFGSLEIENDTRPVPGSAIGREAPNVTGVDPALADQLAAALEQRGLNPGIVGAYDVKNPNRNYFGRIDATLSPVHALTVRHNYVRATDDKEQDRTPTGSTYSFQSNGYFFESTTHSSVVQLNSTFANGLHNELTLGYNRIRDRRTPIENYPVIDVSVTSNVGATTRTRSLRAGAEFFSQGNELDQDSWEITNNLSFNVGQHRLTFGVHNEYFKFRNLFAPGITGQWNFSSIADFTAGQPSQFVRNIPYSPGLDLNARFAVNQLSLYGQTAWNALPNLILTGGLRFDIPFVLDEPLNNAQFETDFGRTTSDVASANGILSPRLGFNWDVNSDRSLQVRGGAGIFTGRHPYVWLSNLYSNNGLQTVSLSCTGSNVPAFTTDPGNQPAQCAAGSIPQPPRAAINVIDPDFKYPHSWKFDAAVDKVLPFGIVGTAEVLYTRAVKQIFLRELNLNLTPVSTTQGGRPVYGTIRAGGTASGNNSSFSTPRRISNNFLQVVELTNSDQDRSLSLTAQLQKRYDAGVELGFSYTYSDAKDISGLTSSIATSNIGFNPVQGNLNDPVLSRSDYETKHKVVLSGTWDVNRWFSWSLLYVGDSGDGYAFTYDGDVNADGYEAPNASNRNNDLLYVPLNQGDVSLLNAADWTNLNRFIEGVPCLRENRGKILTRNVCDEPWHNLVNTRLGFRLPTIAGQRASVDVSILNVMNLLNEDWGRQEGVAFQNVDLLELRGWDVPNNRGIFRPATGLRFNADDEPDVFQVFDPSSRWRASVGIRYSF